MRKSLSMNQNISTWFRRATPFALAILAVVGLADSAAASPRDFARPDEPGPFNVGVTTFAATMSGGRVTRIQVFYPTLDLPDDETRYTILTAAGPYQLRPALGAVHDAPPAADLSPLIVHDHGGSAAGADFHRVAQLPLHEVMASH